MKIQPCARVRSDSFRTPRRRQGVILVLIAVVIIVLLGAVAFSVDVGMMQLSRTKLRIATDTAARAAGEALSRTQNVSQARNAAKTVAAANLVAGRPLILDDGDIIFGNSSLQADRTWTFTPNGAPLNSVRVNGRRTESSLSGAVPLFFAPILGVQRFEPTQTATVVKLDRDICLVVDRSSSMKLDLSTTAQTMSLSDPRANLPPDCSNSRWAALKDAVDEFLDTLDETPQSEHVALASFASDFTWAGVTNRATDLDVPLSANASGIRSQMTTIGNRVFNGATYSAAGVDVGIAALTDPSRARPFAAKTMVYMTDGYRTVGNSPVTNAQAAAAQKITIHTITFGAVFDQTEMVQVAQTTGGNYYHAANANALRDIFREIALTLPLTFAE